MCQYRRPDFSIHVEFITAVVIQKMTYEVVHIRSRVTSVVKSILHASAFKTQTPIEHVPIILPTSMHNVSLTSHIAGQKFISEANNQIQPIRA